MAVGGREERLIGAKAHSTRHRRLLWLAKMPDRLRGTALSHVRLWGVCVSLLSVLPIVTCAAVPHE
jgi:hypothetical protein